MEKLCPKDLITPKEQDPFIQLKQIFKNYESYFNLHKQNQNCNVFNGSISQKESISLNTARFQLKKPESKKSIAKSVSKNFISNSNKSLNKMTFSNRKMTHSVSTNEFGGI